LFGKENLFVGARYNTVSLENIWNTGATGNITDQTKNQQIKDVKIDRTALAAGWFLTKNVLLVQNMCLEL
jgi:hypothetical protein